MKVHVTLRLKDGHQLRDVIVIEEQTLGDLTEEEIEAAIEIRIRSWADKMISIEWETEDE